LVPVPNPNPGAFQVDLAGGADGATLRLWTVALKLVGQETVGPLPAGWSRVPLPWGFLHGLPNGAYYVTLTVRRGPAQAGSAPAKLLIAR
jgi:hypothetical protein